MITWINLIVGGIAGTIARYILSGTVYQICGISFPYGTLAVNILGCFVIGFFVSLSEEKFFLSPGARILLMTGFCGAFTTFSTLIFETNNLIKDGEIFRAFLNISLSVIIGFIVFRIGAFLGEVI